MTKTQDIQAGIDALNLVKSTLNEQIYLLQKALYRERVTEAGFDPNATYSIDPAYKGWIIETDYDGEDPGEDWLDDLLGVNGSLLKQKYYVSDVRNGALILTYIDFHSNRRARYAMILEATQFLIKEQP